MVYRCLKSIQHNIQQLAYPARCVFCDAPGHAGADLCADCYADLPWQTHGCALCALNLPGDSLSVLCPACQKKPPPFSAAFALMRYEYPVNWLITQLKFHARLSHARLLAQLFSEKLMGRLNDDPPQALIPVPLYRQRWRERGFNQATELARPLGKALGIPVLPHAAQRVRATAHQMDLPARQRRANVHDAFTADPGLVLRHVAIVDDVVTTGATAKALTRALHKQGVQRVQLWCAARA